MQEIQRIKQTNIKPDERVNAILKSKGTSLITNGVKMDELLKRTEIDYQDLEIIDKNRPQLTRQEQNEVQRDTLICKLLK